MKALLHGQRGFSLTELMLTVAIIGTIAAMAVPVLTDVSENTKLNAAAREVERELQSARLKAVTNNRSLRVRTNCPSAGYFRTVEVLGTAADTASNRCSPSAYPNQADNDLMTRPNFDGPLRILPNGATVPDYTFEFRPNGTVYAVSGTATTVIAAPVTVTVTRRGQTRSMTINGAGKIEYKLQ
jgi:prepilin-type N-terminal cleavage/methylation domain-containing protein